jgi:hypothetical protein
VRATAHLATTLQQQEVVEPEEDVCTGLLKEKKTQHNTGGHHWTTTRGSGASSTASLSCPWSPTISHPNAMGMGTYAVLTWIVAMTVRPLWAIFWMTFITTPADRLSRPLVGSSAKRAHNQEPMRHAQHTRTIRKKQQRGWKSRPCVSANAHKHASVRPHAPHTQPTNRRNRLPNRLLCEVVCERAACKVRALPTPRASTHGHAWARTQEQDTGVGHQLHANREPLALAHAQATANGPHEGVCHLPKGTSITFIVRKVGVSVWNGEDEGVCARESM